MVNVLSAPEWSCAVSDITPPAEAPEATKREEVLQDSGFLGSSFLESVRGTFLSFLFPSTNQF